MNAHRKVTSQDAVDAGETGADLPSSPLARLRLLVALDALLVEGSVTAAARALDMSAPAMSRLLSQLRVLFGDEILVRTGRGMMPTPLAEQLRVRVRALSAEADDLIRPGAPRAQPPTDALRRLPIVQHPPLAMKPTPLIEGQPDLGTIARRIAAIGSDAEPKQRLAGYIATIGAGAGRSRPLSEDEAADAFRIVLDGEADPIQIGALLVAMQYRGVTPNELAGMVRAARMSCMPLNREPAADLDWPAYLSPRITRPPWFLLSARLVARAGYRVLLHGSASSTERLGEALDAAAIPRVLSLEEARIVLDSDSIAYMPLSAIDPQLQALIALYRLFEMRSPLNMAVQLLNPLGAASTIVGAPSEAGRALHRDAAAMLGWRRLVAIGSNRDVAQATPFRTTPLMILDEGKSEEILLTAAQRQEPAAPRTGFSAMEYWRGLWTGAVKDEHAIEIVVSTAALALMTAAEGTLDHARAREQARQLWSERLRS